jgi:hypothetical protein
VTEIWLEIEDVVKFDNLEQEGQEGHGWLASAALKLPKIQNFKFRKIKGSHV